MVYVVLVFMEENVSKFRPNERLNSEKGSSEETYFWGKGKCTTA